MGHRLFLLVGCQTAIAAVLVLTAMWNSSQVAGHYRHMYEFQLEGIAATADAMKAATKLEPGSRSLDLEAFYRRYRAHWETASGSTPDAIRFRQDLLRGGESELPRLESEVLADFKRSLQSGDTESIKEDLAALYTINVKYAAFENESAMKRIASGHVWLLAIGIAGVVVTLFLGLHVRRAIAPRIKRLVAHVRQFQETGKHERIGDTGKDDIAVLANALDAGFYAIASREREREKFLSIAAHELKTPVTSIQGYASLLVSHPPPVNDIYRALEIINRQSWRLSRLIEALFLALRARSGELRFEPKPFNISELVRRVLQEMEPFLSRRTFSSRIEENISILGDEALLEHALWSLLTCSSAYSPENTSIQVAFYAVGHRAVLTVDISGSDVSLPEIEELFMPFRSVEYETGRGIRSAIGLYLCREIVRVHNGNLLVQQVSEERPEFLMELPI
ncbi:MAG TPA: HAMP domain-containing sensor histidine kinase [Terriglobia bacterium]|nr:HAMP domain-containing sensor histidine kinase [Terriglobia bacterium]